MLLEFEFEKMKFCPIIVELLSAEDKIKDVSLLEEQYKGGGSDNTTPDYLHLYVLSS